jgi:hypothetical protein
MTWLALRLLRPFLITAAALSAAATALTLHGASVVSGQSGDCVDPNLCYPDGPALDAVFRMELVAAFVPPLLGLILGVALFARERESGAVAFVLTQSISRRRWVSTTFGWALGAGLACTLPVAVTHRFVATRYTVLASDTYEMLQLLHLNNIGFMLAWTVLPIALGGVIGLANGRILPTLVLTVVGTPFAFLTAVFVAGVLLTLVARLVGVTEDPPGSFVDDLYTMDPLAYLTGVVAGLATLGLVFWAPRIAHE